jgi:hypothetical protein
MPAFFWLVIPVNAGIQRLSRSVRYHAPYGTSTMIVGCVITHRASGGGFHPPYEFIV